MQLKRTEILIRADGGSVIGLGHLVRCLALAQMLRQDFSICFVCKEIPEVIEKDVLASDFELQRISSEQEFLDRLAPGNIVVIDHYGFSSDDQQKVKLAGCKLVSIDDIHEKHFFADLIINHTPGIRAEDYDAEYYTEFALGLDYVLLRPAFLTAALQTKSLESEGTVFICFGGADQLNYTERVLRVVIEQNHFSRIIVVAGSAYASIIALKTLAEKYENVEVYQSLDEHQMLELMLAAAIAVVPASGILLEALTAKCQVISGMYVENQKLLFKAYKEQGIIVSAEHFSVEQLALALKQISQQETGREHLIDGKSGERLLHRFKLLAQDADYSLRKANEADLETTFNWAKNKTIRAFSFSQNEISFEEHENWFYRKINDANCYYLIFEEKGQPAGTFRFDLKEEEAVISYFLDPEFHGKGIGTVLLKKGVEWLANQKNENIKIVSGDVMNGNRASMRAFEKLNFTRHSLKDDITRFTKKIHENQQ